MSVRGKKPNTRVQNELMPQDCKPCAMQNWRNSLKTCLRLFVSKSDLPSFWCLPDSSVPFSLCRVGVQERRTTCARSSPCASSVRETGAAWPETYVRWGAAKWLPQAPTSDGLPALQRWIRVLHPRRSKVGENIWQSGRHSPASFHSKGAEQRRK